jgi:hypothetical protein
MSFSIKLKEMTNSNVVWNDYANSFPTRYTDRGTNFDLIAQQEATNTVNDGGIIVDVGCGVRGTLEGHLRCFSYQLDPFVTQLPQKYIRPLSYQDFEGMYYQNGLCRFKNPSSTDPRFTKILFLFRGSINYLSKEELQLLGNIPVPKTFCFNTFSVANLQDTIRDYSSANGDQGTEVSIVKNDRIKHILLPDNKPAIYHEFYIYDFYILRELLKFEQPHVYVNHKNTLILSANSHFKEDSDD